MSELITDAALSDLAAARAAPVGRAGESGWRAKLSWSIGATSMGAANYAKILILAFLVDYAGIAPAIAATLIALSNLYDAVIDPLIGAASDRTHSRWGRRVPYLFAAAIGLPLAWLMMFNLPSFSPAVLIGYIFLALLLYSTAYGAFSVPFNAMPAEMTSGYHSRSTLMVLRTLFTMVGTTAGGFLAPTLIAKFGGGRPGHAGMALAMAGLTLVTGLVCVIGVARYAIRSQPDVASHGAPTLSFRQRATSVLKNRHFLVLMLSHFLAMTGIAIMNSGVIFYVRRVLGANDLWLGKFYFWMNLFIFVSLPIWLWLSRWIGKRNAFILGAVVLGLTMLDWRFASLADPTWVFLTRTFLTSFGSAAVLLMSAAMLPDAMDYDRLTTGLSRAGVFSGLYTTVEKGTAALGVAVSGFILAGAGYAQSSGAVVKQSKSALEAVTFTFATAPGVLILLSGVAMIFYSLSEKELKRLGQAQPAAAG